MKTVQESPLAFVPLIAPPEDSCTVAVDEMSWFEPLAPVEVSGPVALTPRIAAQPAAVPGAAPYVEPSAE